MFGLLLIGLVEATPPFPLAVRRAGAHSGDDWLVSSVGSPPTIAEYQ